MNPKQAKELQQAKELLRRSEVRFENLIKAMNRYNIHIDVICHDYVPSPNEVAKSHTLTTSCNPKKIAFAYIKDNPAQELLDIVDAVIETENPLHQKGGV